MKITIDLKEIMKYLDNKLLYKAFLEFSQRATVEELIDMQKYLTACIAFSSTPEKKK